MNSPTTQTQACKSGVGGQTRTIRYGSEFMLLHEGGFISRPAIGMHTPSGHWKITGAVERNNFGAVVRHYSLADIFAGNIPWACKNGAQRVFVQDLDHGTQREWRSPSHSIS